MDKNNSIPEGGHALPDRREFLGLGLAATAAALLGGVNYGAGQSSPIGVTSPGMSVGDRRRLGSLEVSALGFGSMETAGMYNPAMDKQEAIRLIRAAYDR